jgi:hypothetical protein
MNIRMADACGMDTDQNIPIPEGRQWDFLVLRGCLGWMRRTVFISRLYMIEVRNPVLYSLFPCIIPDL